MLAGLTSRLASRSRMLARCARKVGSKPVRLTPTGERQAAASASASAKTSGCALCRAVRSLRVSVALSLMEDGLPRRGDTVAPTPLDPRDEAIPCRAHAAAQEDALPGRCRNSQTIECGARHGLGWAFAARTLRSVAFSSPPRFAFPT